MALAVLFGVFGGTVQAQAACPATPAATALSLGTLQMPLTGSWGYNHTPSRQDAIWTVCTGTEWVQYMVLVGPKVVGGEEFNVPWIQRRTLPSGSWSQPVDLGPALGITGPENDVEDDLHHGFTVWTEPAGHVHVMGNVHSQPITAGGTSRYIRSTTSHDLTRFDQVTISDAAIDAAYSVAGVTMPRDRYKSPAESYPLSYPQYVKAPGSNGAYLFLRTGNSLAGDLLQLQWDPVGRTWTDAKLVVSDSNRQATNVRGDAFCPTRVGFPKDVPGQTYRGLETVSSTAPYVYRIDVETGSRAGDTPGRVHVAWTWRKFITGSGGQCRVHSSDRVPLFSHFDLSYASFTAADGTWRNSRGDVLPLPIGKNGHAGARVVQGPSLPSQGTCTDKDFETFLANRFGFSNDGGAIKTRSAAGDRFWIASTAQRSVTSCTDSVGLVRKPFAATLSLGPGATTTISDVTEDADQNPGTARTVVPMRGRPALVSSKWDSDGTTAPLLVYVNDSTGWPTLGELTGALRHAPLARVPMEKTEPILSLTGARSRNELHLLLTPSETSSSVVPTKQRLDNPATPEPNDGPLVENDAAEYQNRDREQRNFDRQQGALLSIGLDDASRGAFFAGSVSVPEITTTHMMTATLQRTAQATATFGSSLGLAGQLAAGQRPLVRLLTTGTWMTGRIVADLEAMTTAGPVAIGRVRLGPARRRYDTAWLPMREKLSGLPPGATITGLRLTRTDLSPSATPSGQIDLTILVGRLG